MKRKYPATKAHPSTIVIHCCDPRFGLAFRDFIGAKLGLPLCEFVPIVIAGGPAALARETTKSNDFFCLLSQIVFFMRHFKSINKIVLIGHEDCGYYSTIRNRNDKKDREKADLPKAASAIDTLLQHVEIELYYARFTDKDQTEIVFEEV
jgi:carbonic anhydrase